MEARPNVKITLWFACVEDAKAFCAENAIGGWRFQVNGQRVYVEAPPFISELDWSEFGEMIGV